jgi:hypothetical protein
MGGDVSAPMLPDPPAPDVLRSLGIQADETRVIQTAEVWWRVHRTVGGHVLAWNAFRAYGPLLRFDPHALPRGEDPGHGVWYGAWTPDAALGEAFQVDRTIDRELGSPYLTGLSFTRPLTVLDLATDSAGAWATRVGGTFAMSTGCHRLAGTDVTHRLTCGVVCSGDWVAEQRRNAAAASEGQTFPTSTNAITRYTAQLGKVANIARVTDEAIQDKID